MVMLWTATTRVAFRHRGQHAVLRVLLHQAGRVTVPLRLGPITLPWPGKPADDPYWDFFLRTPPHDFQNSAVDLVQKAPEGAINPAQEMIHTPEINARHVKELATFLG